MNDKKQEREKRFKIFIESQVGYSSTLPLTHITSAYSFRDIVGNDYIEPVECPFFKEELIYLFYGRPAYRASHGHINRLKFNWPILFIFKPECITEIKRVFTFDTGAFFSGFYKAIFSSQSDWSDFELPPRLESAKKMVDAFYDDAKTYYKGESNKNIVKSNFDFEIQGIEYLARQPGQQAFNEKRRIDERSSAVEIQVNKPIDISSGLLALVMPEEYISDNLVIEAVKRWNIAEKVKPFTAIYGPNSEAWIGALYQIVSQIYIENGYFG